MWRCAGRSFIGVLGALHIQQHPAFAEPVVLSSTFGAKSFSNSETRLSSTANTAGTAVEQSAPKQQPKGRDELEPTDNHHRKAQWPQKLEYGTHFAVLNGSDGTASSLGSISTAMHTADVVMLGEYHDDPVAHALQLELLKRVARQLGYQLGQPYRPGGGGGGNSNSKSPADDPLQQQQQQQQQDGASTQPQADAPSQQQQQQRQQPQQQQPTRPLVLSFEMFERDVQIVLDEYLAGIITLQDLLRDSRPWPNYSRDYGPLLEYCKHHNIQVLAANAPRRYVSLAGKRGRTALDELSSEAKAYLAPLPYAQPSPRYIDKVHRTMNKAAEDMQQLRQQQQQLKQHKAVLEHQPGQAILQHQGNTSGRSSSSSDDRARKEDSSLKGSDKLQQVAVAATAGAPSSDATKDKVFNESSAAATAVEAALEADPPGACPYIGFNVSSNFTDAQVLWDATMAQSIAQQLVVQCAAGPSTPMTAGIATNIMSSIGGNQSDVKPEAAATIATASKPLVVHICGKFHCEEGLGIPEHLAKYAPGTRILCIVFVPSASVQLTVEEFHQSGLKGLGDFVVLTDARLPRSFASVHPV